MVHDAMISNRSETNGIGLVATRGKMPRPPKEDESMSRRATRVRVTSDMQYADIPYFLTTADVEVLTGQSQATIRRAIREGKIKADLIGGQYRICRDTIFQNTKEALSA